MPEKIAIISKDYKAYKKLFEANPFPQAELIFCSNKFNPDAAQEANILLGEPNLAARFIDNLYQLKWMQSTWAGNFILQQQKNHSYILTGVKDVFGNAMKEFIFAYILHFYREIDTFKKLQAGLIWDLPHIKPLKGQTLGILGLGNIGREIAEAAAIFDLKVVGLNSNGDGIGSFKCYSTDDILLVAKTANIVVNLLPETQKTKGLCNRDFFNSMPEGSIFINVGRGSIIDTPETLIDALNSGPLRAAVLDVFEQEPLPQSHSFYGHSNILITNHSAGKSLPSAIFDIFQANFNAFVNAIPMKYVHDFNREY